MQKRLVLTSLVVVGICVPAAIGQSVGNPVPGAPHDTVIIHVQKADNGPKGCAGSTGGHSLFLREYGGVVPPTYIYVTMTDWVRLDNDGDGRFDEDPTVNGIDEDNDGKDGEDVLEPGAETMALDCDSWGDNKVEIQIRDTEPEKDVVSLQQWFIRLIGKPNQNFAFTSYANQTVVCKTIDPDGVANSGDETAQCTTGTSNTVADWVKLTAFNADAGSCVKQVKGAGGGGVKAGGKTPFCDISSGFNVSVDYDPLDGVVVPDQFIFGVRVGCLDDPLTTTVDESKSCPLSGVVWGTDEDTTSEAKAQISVAHVGAVNVKTGKIVN
jgi:hypothetical protein